MEKIKQPQDCKFYFWKCAGNENFCDAYTLVACYQDDDITQQGAADLLEGKIVSMGRLPVSFCQYKIDDGIVHGGVKPMKAATSKDKLIRYRFHSLRWDS